MANLGSIASAVPERADDDGDRPGGNQEHVLPDSTATNIVTNLISLALPVSDHTDETDPGVFDCAICMSNGVATTQSVCLPGCNHRYCSECMSGYLASRVADGDVLNVRCPHWWEGCLQHIDDEAFVRTVLDEAQVTRWIRLRKLKSVPSARECPKCNTIAEGQPQTQQLRCPKPECGAEFCLLHGDLHPNDTCANFERRMQMRDNRSEGWKRRHAVPCPKCHEFIEKDGGCNHMTCRVCPGGTHFCFLCTREFTGSSSSYHATPSARYSCVLLSFVRLVKIVVLGMPLPLGLAYSLFFAVVLGVAVLIGVPAWIALYIGMLFLICPPWLALRGCLKHRGPLVWTGASGRAYDVWSVPWLLGVTMFASTLPIFIIGMVCGGLVCHVPFPFCAAVVVWRTKQLKRTVRIPVTALCILVPFVPLVVSSTVQWISNYKRLVRHYPSRSKLVCKLIVTVCLIGPILFSPFVWIFFYPLLRSAPLVFTRFKPTLPTPQQYLSGALSLIGYRRPELPLPVSWLDPEQPVHPGPVAADLEAGGGGGAAVVAPVPRATDGTATDAALGDEAPEGADPHRSPAPNGRGLVTVSADPPAGNPTGAHGPAAIVVIVAGDERVNSVTHGGAVPPGVADADAPAVVVALGGGEATGEGEGRFESLDRQVGFDVAKSVNPLYVV
mmetsp:Transcript_328/g.940  ORF Transcript_328/g.940 Transcript_328/m.940 type:complete len:670 (+) Transcript_328:114-2123(+)